MCLVTNVPLVKRVDTNEQVALVLVGFCDGSQDLQSLMYVCCASTMPTLGLEDEKNFEDVTKATTLL